MQCRLLLLTVAVLLLSPRQIYGETAGGHCVWYGECRDTPTGKQNCVYNGPAKPLTDTRALSILQKMCPRLYKGASTRTCCSPTQLYTLEQNMALVEQFLMICPSCYYNFLNIYCYLTCDPHHSSSIGVKTSVPNNISVPSVTAVDYTMATQFAYGMFNSCKDVQAPSIGISVLDILCGRPASQCTPQNWLQYMGSTSNGATPFEIDFHVQDRPWSSAQYTLNPMNVTAVPCFEKYGNHPACASTDCPAEPAPITPRLPNISDLYPWPTYRVEQLVITRPKNKTQIRHNLPPPVIGTLNFSSLFDNTFLHMLLDLQLGVQSLTAQYKGNNITLNDICYRGNANENCVILSMLEYWQNSHERLDQIAWDEYHFFIVADYMDHLMACYHLANSTSDHTPLNMSCVSTSGVPVDPWVVMEDEGRGWPETEKFVISLIVKNHKNEEDNAPAETWEKAFSDFISGYSSPNMTVNFSTKRPITDGHRFPNPVVILNQNGAFPDNNLVSAATWPRSCVIQVVTFVVCIFCLRNLF